MRRPAGTALVGILALALAALVASAAARPAGEAEARSILDVGDSLSVGAAPYLAQQLRGYRIEQAHDVGLHADDAARLVAAHGASLPRVIVVSAGTNDDPRLPSAFRRAVTRVLATAGARRCVVWPTIVRPPVVGASYAALNGVLRRLAVRHGSLVVVDWVALVRRHPAWLSRDGVHVSAAGYRARAAAVAAAVEARCGR